MIKRILTSFVGIIILGTLTGTPVSAQVLKKAKDCEAEYKANKPAIQAAKELKRDFIAACRTLAPGTQTPIGGAPSTPAPEAAPAPPPGRTPAANGLKTARACDDEYKTNKPAIRAAKVLKRDYIAACRVLPVGTPTPIGGVAPPPLAPATPSPAPEPGPTSSPAPAPPPPAAPAPSPRSQAPAQPAGSGENACANGYAHLPASHTALQFCTDHEAQARCPGQPIVWVNTASKIYHKAGSNTYGHTKVGAYMCESDATAEGDRPSRNGH